MGRGNLAGDAEDRGIAGVGGRERRRRVQNPGAGHDQAHAWATGRLREAEGHVGGRLLMAGMDDLDRILRVVQRVEDPIELQAGQAEHGIDGVPAQPLDEDRRSGRFAREAQSALIPIAW